MIDTIYATDNPVKHNLPDPAHWQVFDAYRKMNVPDINNPAWPEAIDPALICPPDSEPDKKLRAANIIQMIQEPLQGKKFLDFGCGEGHITRRARELGADATGYDIVNQRWNRSDNFLTTDLNVVNKTALFDIILLYDVLDHVVNQTPEEVLTIVGNILNPDGAIYVRCHPWCSRHGTHLFRTLNKAYAHIVMSEDELAGHTGLPTHKVLYPVKTYNRWFKSSNLFVASHRPWHEPVPAFFTDNLFVADRIISHYHDNNNVFPRHQLQQQFHDYVLKKVPPVLIAPTSS